MELSILITHTGTTWLFMVDLDHAEISSKTAKQLMSVGNWVYEGNEWG